MLVLFAFCFVPVGLAIGSNEAGDALRRAEVDFGSAFAAVADAERAGANVTAFVGRLNNADDFLAEGYAEAGIMKMRCRWLRPAAVLRKELSMMLRI
jgi:hypothetical protein